MIRFMCPGCRQPLTSQAEHVGKRVTCPKCGQRLQVPRSTAAQRSGDARPRRTAPAARKPSCLPLALCVLLLGVLLSAGAAGGIWFLKHSDRSEPEPALVSAPPSNPNPPSTKPAPPPATNKPKPEPEAPKPAPEKPETKPAPEKPPVVEPPADKTPPPPVEKKDIALADDVPPELPFDLVDAINVHREKAGLEPIFLDAELSHACQARAERLARHSGKIADNGLSAKGSTDTIAAEAPLAVIEQWMQGPAQRAALLEPRLRTFGAGFALNVEGQWFSVFDWTHGRDAEPLPVAATIKDALVYPVPGQSRVWLWFPGNELPDPLPKAEDKLAGYPITLTFPARTRVASVTAQLSNKEEREVAVWLSSPEQPANPDFPQQNTICLIAKKPLRPSTRYHVEVAATVEGRPWSAKWDFTTVSEGEIQHRLAGQLLRTLNRLRRHAGLRPVSLDAERSKACEAHARYLGHNAPAQPGLNWNAEKADLPGYTEEGAAIARSAAIQGGGGPVQAVAGLVDSLISRPQVLDPHLRQLGVGYTPFASGGWVWVMDLRRDDGRDLGREYFYPAPDQESVPLNYPIHEVPTPIPADHKDRMAGYAITVLFGRGMRVSAATAKLVDGSEASVEGWVSSPEKPAIAGFPQRSLCFLPKSPLRPNTRYTVTFEAEVNSRPWRRSWSFTTVKDPDHFADDLEERVLAQVNTVRKTAGLDPVTLDAKLSQGCQSHAHYLALNSQRAETQGLGVHREKAGLPGATAEGEKAARQSVIVVGLDPQTCVENWMATLYHRLPILRPDLERVGFGLARLHGHKWACVLDTGNGRKPSPGKASGKK